MTKEQANFIDAFNTLANTAHANARAKGFWDTHDKLMNLASAHGMGKELWKMRGSQLRDLIVSEFGEACDGARKDLPSEKCPGFTNEEEEYADAVIRLMDMATGMGLRIAEAVVAKMNFNSGREAMHGGKQF